MRTKILIGISCTIIFLLLIGCAQKDVIEVEEVKVNRSIEGDGRSERVLRTCLTFRNEHPL